jgi:transposase
MSCWRRLCDWQKAGGWQKIHEVLLSKLREADQIDWSRAVTDSASIRALYGGEKTGKNPTDRGKKGSKHHLITDAQGIPLAFILTGANRNDVTQLIPLVEAIPPIGGKVGRPRRRPDKVQADRGYDSEPHREELRALGIEPVIGKRNTEHGSGLGVFRWVVERTLSWLHQFRRLRIRYERRPEIHEAFLSIGCSLICWNFLTSFC